MQALAEGSNEDFQSQNLQTSLQQKRFSEELRDALFLQTIAVFMNANH